MNLRPWKLWNPDGTPAEGTNEIVATLEGVLRRDPDHIGAMHLYIHAVEASPHPERALPYADRIAALAPAAGHLVHMPAHIYERTGNYDGAREHNAAAAKADEDYAAATGAQGMYMMMYYSHNLHFGAIAAAMQGHCAEAQRSADRLADNLRPAAKEMPMVEPFIGSSVCDCGALRKMGRPAGHEGAGGADTGSQGVLAVWPRHGAGGARKNGGGGSGRKATGRHRKGNVARGHLHAAGRKSLLADLSYRR